MEHNSTKNPTTISERRESNDVTDYAVPIGKIVESVHHRDYSLLKNYFEVNGEPDLTLMRDYQLRSNLDLLDDHKKHRQNSSDLNFGYSVPLRNENTDPEYAVPVKGITAIFSPVIDDQGYAVPRSILRKDEDICSCARQDFVEWYYKTTKSVLKTLSSIDSDKSFGLSDSDDTSGQSLDDHLILDSDSGYARRQGTPSKKRSSESLRSSDTTHRTKPFDTLPETLSNICIRIMMENVMASLRQCLRLSRLKLVSFSFDYSRKFSP